MANLKEVKERIKSVSSTKQITNAMKMVAAAKLRRAQDRIIQLRPYSEKFAAILANVSGGDEEGISTYAAEREMKKVLLVPVTSDRGLCGLFNSNIFKELRNMLNSEAMNGVEVSILPIGKKSYEFYKKRDYNLIDDYWGIFGNLNFDTVREAAEYAMSAFESGHYDRIYLIYNEFKNVATQVVRTEQFLPVLAAESEEAAANDYLYEPSKDFIVDELIPKSLKIQFYKSVLESNASEHGARMTAMGKATDNADELLKELKLTYNRTRQAAITKEILEIVGGAEALAADA